MLDLLVTLPLAAGLMLTAESEAPIELRGRCQYSEAVQEHASDTVLITCDHLAIANKGGGLEITFGQRSFSDMAVFSGFDADGLIEIDRLTLRNGSTYEAEGTCEIIYGDNNIDTVACLVRARGTFYAANFVTSRIDP